MSLASMTGFARAAGTWDDLAWAWEVKSVNGRGLDARIRTPSGFDGLEQPARAAVQKRFARGTVHVGLQTRREAEGDPPPRIDLDRIRDLVAQLQPLTAQGVLTAPTADGLLGVRGVVTTASAELDDDAVAARDAALLTGLEEALDGLVEARAGEGAALLAVLAGVVDRIDALRAAAAENAEAQPEAIRARIAAQLAELAGEGMPDERAAQEAAVLTLKADVREELDRLAAHVAQARELFAAGKPVGRKLDFLAQEFMREANTLCAKSASVALTRIGLDLKEAVDQLREQVQNVE